MSASDKAPPAIAALLVGIDIDVADVIVTQSKASAKVLRGEGARGWACWTDYDIGTYHGDLESVEVVLGRSLSREETATLEGCIRFWLQDLDESGAP